MTKLDRPIFICGPARSGTTLLSAIINWHKDVGPRHKEMTKHKSLQSFMNTLVGHHDPRKEGLYSMKMEQNDEWFRYTPRIFPNQYNNEFKITKLDEEKKLALTQCLTEKFHEKRFLSKSPGNSFRLQLIRNTFEDCKILFIYRNPIATISSWSKNYYPPINEEHLFFIARLWNDIVVKISNTITEPCMVIGYETLCGNTSESVRKILDFIGLEMDASIKDVKITSQNNNSTRFALEKGICQRLVEATSVGGEIIQQMADKQGNEFLTQTVTI